jgi:hypothetical protein
MTSEQTKALIKALIVERDGYVKYGRLDRAEQVDAYLASIGHNAKTPAKRATNMKARKGTEL